MEKRWTRDLLHINWYIHKESKTRWKNVAMAWIDSKNEYDMVPQSWILNCLKMYKISNEVIKFIKKKKKEKKKWKTRE